MRAGLIIVGIVLLGLGVWVALGGLHYNDTKAKIDVGPIKGEITSQKTVPAPIGYAGIVVGGVLILVGALKKSR